MRIPKRDDTLDVQQILPPNFAKMDVDQVIVSEAKQREEREIDFSGDWI